MIGIAPSTKVERRGLVATIIAPAPMNRTRLRSATEIDEPTADFTCVVSAVSRDMISPVWVRSKKDGDSVMTCANTWARRSATIRSPRVVTR